MSAHNISVSTTPYAPAAFGRGMESTALVPAEPRERYHGMAIRSGVLTTQSVWDDTDIVHVVYNQIIIDNSYGGSGLRLESTPDESLVIKLSGASAGFTVRGTPNDTADRIGGTLQVLGQGTHPVVFTSLSDDTVGAGFIPGVARTPQTDTNGDGSLTSPSPGNWQGIRIEKYSNDRNVAVVNETEPSADATAAQSNDAKATAQVADADRAMAEHDPTDHVGLVALGERHATLVSEVAELEERWMELAETVEGT